MTSMRKFLAASLRNRAIACGISCWSSGDICCAPEICSNVSSVKKLQITWALNDNNLPNNAYFIGYLTYQSKQNQFKDEFAKDFKGNFHNYLTYLKDKYPSSIVF